MFSTIRPLFEQLDAISYVEAYGQGDFDGQSSGHDFYGVSFSGGLTVACERMARSASRVLLRGHACG